MKHSNALRVFILIGLVGMILSVNLCSTADSRSPSAVENTKQKLTGVSSEEQRVATSLFELSSQISLLDTRIAKLNADISTQRRQAIEKQQQIDLATASFERARNSMGEILRSRQRAGAGSTLEILLSAENLKDLIQRVNLLQDLSHSASAQMQAIETARATLNKEQQALADLVKHLEAQQQELRAAKEKQNGVRRTLENKLNALHAEKGFYTDYLQTMEGRWRSLKPLFSQTVKSFNGIIASGGLPPDTVTMSYSLFYSKVTFLQNAFNRALAARSDLPKMVFTLHTDSVTLEFPTYEMQLQGHFRLVNPQTLEYVVTGGAFYGTALSPSALQDLFSEGDFVFSLKTMIGTNRIQRIDPHEGTMDLWINGTPN